MTEKQWIACKVKEIRLSIGAGNHLFLFQGDKIQISKEPNQRKRHTLYNSSGIAVGSLNGKAILWIQGEREPAPKGGRHALATQQSV